ncbi:MAG: cytochrome C biogenesis protein CycH [Omnitrophica WOR_2 bacterium GWA2_37_7]|nr:MAG: cytochrome C biogenesis protein CycH [Omnitrophica WOR_2 bacterium GWA2_37_7]
MKKNLQNIEGGKVVLYKKGLEVQLRDDTVWINQKQMAELFNTERSVITKHLGNIFTSKELDQKSVCANFAHTASDGKLYKTKFYNLDAIISVGYRVNSKQGTQFRIWATDVLKKHLVDGYTINEKRLKCIESKYRELQNAVSLIGNVIEVEDLSAEAKGLIGVISKYSRALDILDDFDHQKLEAPKGTKRSRYKITYEKALTIIESMKKEFSSSGLVGLEKDDSFKSSLGAIYQTFEGRDLYPTLEEKAANLLYFVAKNHSFVDGNKRIAAALFVYFLNENGILYYKNGSCRIDENALVALTLMVAASKPSEKDIMIKVILNLIKVTVGR